VWLLMTSEGRGLFGRQGNGRRWGVPEMYSGSNSTFPVNRALPYIEGSGYVGSLLTCHRGVWRGQAPITYDYQWRRDEIDINGETSDTYVTQLADVEAEIDCVVTATNVFGVTSAFTAKAANPWRDALLISPSLRVFDSKDLQIADLSPVAVWEDVRRDDQLEQAVSSARPIYLDGAVVFELDDHLHCDALAAYAANGHTMIFSCKDVQITGTSQHCLCMFAGSSSTATLRIVRVQAGGTFNATRWGYLTSSGATGENIQTTMINVASANPKFVLRNLDRGDAQQVLLLQDPLDLKASDTRGASNLSTGTWATFGIGSRRFGGVSSPSLQNFWNGSIEWMALIDRALDDSEIITLLNCASKAGY